MGAYLVVIVFVYVVTGTACATVIAEATFVFQSSTLQLHMLLKGKRKTKSASNDRMSCRLPASCWHLLLQYAELLTRLFFFASVALNFFILSFTHNFPVLYLGLNFCGFGCGLFFACCNCKISHVEQEAEHAFLANMPSTDLSQAQKACHLEPFAYDLQLLPVLASRHWL
jgi:hypothetical protein